MGIDTGAVYQYLAPIENKPTNQQSLPKIPLGVLSQGNFYLL